MDESDKRAGRSWPTPVPQVLRENPRTSILAAAAVLLMTGSGAGAWIMKPVEPRQTVVVPDPLVNYRLDLIEKRLEKIEKILEGRKR